MAKHWDYSDDATTHSCGLMKCCSCGKDITEGPFRWRETDAAYVTQHRTCSEGDPKWAALDAEAAKRAATSKIIDELETLASDLSSGLDPSNPALLEAVRRSLQSLT